MQYPYATIRINGREVSLQDILKDNETPRDDFEKSTFSFIRQWHGPQRDFELRTSGSTGPPKKITITRDQMIASARATAKAIDLRQGYTALTCLDTSYIAGQMMLVRSFTTGMKVIAVTPSANPFRRLDVRDKIDFTALVPYQVQAVIQSPEDAYFNTIGIIIIGGAALPLQAREQLQRYQARFFATYGMTETLSHIALQPLNGKDASAYFQVLPGIVVQQDERHCLVIEAPHLPEKVVTNDVVELQNSTHFQWLGRFDTIINSGGVKVIPEKVEAEVEKALRCLNIYCDFFISGVPDSQLGEKIILIIKEKILTDEELGNLYTALQKSLSRYEIPKEVIVLKSFDMTETGKINRYSTLENLDKSLQKFTFKK
jgi:O-succinylbenzoic acid--CoA ligase